MGIPGAGRRLFYAGNDAVSYDRRPPVGYLRPFSVALVLAYSYIAHASPSRSCIRTKVLG